MQVEEICHCGSPGCIYRQVSNMRRTKSQHFKDSRTVLRLSLQNPVKPYVKSRMKMQLEQRRQAMLQLHLNDGQFYCLLRCNLYWRFYGIHLSVNRVFADDLVRSGEILMPPIPEMNVIHVNVASVTRFKMKVRRIVIEMGRINTPYGVLEWWNPRSHLTDLQ